MLFINILAHSQGVLESGFIISKYYPEFIPLKQVHNIGELRSSDSFKSVEGSVSWVGAFGNDPIGVIRCSRILAIESRPAKMVLNFVTWVVQWAYNNKPYLSFVGFAINRGIWDTSFTSLQVIKVIVTYSWIIQEKVCSARFRIPLFSPSFPQKGCPKSQFGLKCQSKNDC